MDAHALKGPFQATIEASLASLQQLREILLAEQQALLGDQPDTLERVVHQKADILQQLEHSVQAREQLLQQLGLPGGLVGAEQFAQQHFRPEELLETWKQLVGLSREVNEINNHNGKLTLARERTTREALGILTGRPQSTDTYSRKGGHNSGLSAYSLGKC